ncbi:MAG: PKD domain-containing protein [Flavobacteriaceae bacterium]|nr:MAG: PKD domain-containing protein [Flavobacteriaceae bacterium]
MEQAIKNINNRISKIAISLLTLAVTTLYIACEDNTLPEVGSIPDLTPPTANFSATQGSGAGDAWKVYTFANLSTSVTDYSWNFGDGNTSTAVEPTNTFPGEGTYTVTLTASDKLGVTNTHSQAIEVVEPQAPVIIVPPILEASFEDGTLDGGTGDGRDSWRNSSMGGVIQITSSPVHEGSQASKYPSAGDRIAYQELGVSPNSDYILTYWYTIKTSPVGSITVSVLAGGGFTNVADIPAATIASFEGTDQSSANTYVKVDLPFNSGANSTVSIFVTNQGAEARLDSFSIVSN